MPSPHFPWSIFAKALGAFVLLALLAGVAGHQLAPAVPLATVLLYAALGAAALLGILVAVTAVMLTVRQFILRKGGTDTQWYWFPSEPRGLVQLRAQGRAGTAQPRR